MIKIEKNMLRVIITSCVVLFLGYFTLSMPTRFGDGHEYSMVTQALINHFSPNITQEDIHQREKQILAYPNREYYLHIFSEVKQLIDQGKETDYYSVFRAKNGQYYGTHFWLYPAYVAVIETIFNLFGANPLAGFQLANAILFLAALGYCLFYGKIETERRMMLCAAFIFGGSLFYLSWTHPEVFIASLIFIGFVALFQMRFYIFFPCIALVSLQIISIYPVFFAAPLLLLLQHKVIFNDQLKRLSQCCWVWFSLVLPLCSFWFYYVNFGKLNLLAAHFTNIKLISWSHLYSFWFDLDQGVFVGVPWLLLPLIFFLYRINRTSKECKLAFLISVLSSICICIPLLANSCINSGHSVFHRYGLYAVSPLISWSGFYLIEIITIRWLRITLFLCAGGYATLFLYPNVREDYLEHKYWTKKILEKFPEYYNPEPGVFYARTLGKNWKVDYDNAVVSRDKQGIIRKILFPIDKAELAMSKICVGQLVEDNGLPINYSTAKHGAYGWVYLNGHFHCNGIDLSTIKNLNFKPNPQYKATLTSGIDFTRNGFPSFLHVVGGLSHYEGWGIWSDGPLVILNITDPLPKNFEIKLKMGAFADNVGKPVKITVAGETKELIVTSNDPREYLVKFTLPKKLKGVYLMIKPANPMSPKSIGLSDDSRLLGLSFYSMSFIIPQKKVENNGDQALPFDFNPEMPNTLSFLLSDLLGSSAIQNSYLFLPK